MRSCGSQSAILNRRTVSCVAETSAVEYDLDIRVHSGIGGNLVRGLPAEMTVSAGFFYIPCSVSLFCAAAISCCRRSGVRVMALSGPGAVSANASKKSRSHVSWVQSVPPTRTVLNLCPRTPLIAQRQAVLTWSFAPPLRDGSHETSGTS